MLFEWLSSPGYTTHSSDLYLTPYPILDDISKETFCTGILERGFWVLSFEFLEQFLINHLFFKVVPTLESTSHIPRFEFYFPSNYEITLLLMPTIVLPFLNLSIKRLVVYSPTNRIPLRDVLGFDTFGAIDGRLINDFAFLVT